MAWDNATEESQSIAFKVNVRWTCFLVLPLFLAWVFFPGIMDWVTYGLFNWLHSALISHLKI